MNQLINSCPGVLNNIGRWFCNYGAGIFIQSSILIILLLIIDLVMRKHVRATFRYWIWMLVLLKLMLPPAFSSPTGIGYWFRDYLPAHSSVPAQVPNMIQLEPTGAPAPEDSTIAAEIPQIHPSQINPEPAAPATPAFSDFQALTWQAVVFVIWLVGVTVLSTLLIHRMLFVRRLIAQSEPSKNRYAEIVDQCCQQLGIKRRTELRLSGKLQSPAVCGLFRPVILMPAGLLEKLSPDKLRAVLIHELAHIKRGDLWVNCVQTFLQIAYFYNPLVWLANTVVRTIREQAVDEMVLVALGAGAKDYSNTLIDIAEMAFFKTSLSLRLIGVVESKKALRRRIRHMLNRPIPESTKLGILGLMVIFVIAAVLLPMAKARKKDPDIVENEQINSQFIATLPNGVKVELVGVCEHPSEGKQWWRPDGSKLSQRPFEKLYQRCYTKREYYELALKVGSPENRKLSIDSKGGGVFNLYPDNIWGGWVLSEGKKMRNQSIGIAQGPWKTIMEADPMHTQSFGDIAFGRAFESDYELIGAAVGVTATYTIEKEKVDCRIIAVDRESNIHTSSGSSGIGNGLWMQRTVHFRDLQIDEIKEFQFQTRPYQWVEFKNVSLKPNFKTDAQVESKEGWGEAVYGLRVGMSIKKTSFAMEEPIQIQWRIKNVSQEDKTIIWHKLQYSPVVFEIGKSGEKKYIREDEGRLFNHAIPGPPEKLILKPGETKEAIFDLRRFGLNNYSERGTYEVTGLYSPKNSRILTDVFLQKPEFKGVIDARIDSATIEITLTEDLAWLRNELSTGTFQRRLSASRSLVPIIGNKDVLAELEKMYPSKNTREMVWLVDHMAQFGDLSHVGDVLDMYETGGYAPHWKDYGDDMLVFLLKWGRDRGIAQLIQYVVKNKDTSENSFENRNKRNFLKALIKGSYWYFNFEISDESLPLLILVLDEKTVQGGMTLESGKKVELRWCDNAALAIQKMLKRDWGFQLELPEQTRDGIINQMRNELSNRNSAVQDEVEEH